MNNMSLIKFIIRCGMIFSIIAGIYFFLSIPKFIPSFGASKSINILVWPNVIDAKHCAEFEKRTGIKVYLTYFESYESLLVKIKASGGADYDLVMIADYFIGDMIKQELIQKIDRSKIVFWDHIHPELLNLPFDRGNEYTVPFSWEAYGVGVDMTYFADKPIDDTWGILFDNAHSHHPVGMLDAAREVVAIASLYLFGHQETLNDEQLAQIKSLLIKQKKWVAMYSDLRSDYILASKLAPVVMTISSDMYQAMRYNKDIKFLLPREGSFMMLDSFVVPAKSEKQEFVYEFLNYLYQPEIIREYVRRYNFFPALKKAHVDDHLFLIPIQLLLDRLRLFPHQTTEQKLRELWIALKA